MVEHRQLGPARVSFGDALVESTLPRALGDARAVLVVTTGSAVKNPKLLERVQAQLRERDVTVVSEIKEHVPVETLRALGQRRVDAVVSLGGGSPIDAGKLAVAMQATGLTAEHLGSFKSTAPLGAAPIHVALPTTLSGAELSPTAGFTVNGRKTGLFHPSLAPTWVLADARLALETPLPLWLSTGVRSIDHAVEGLLAEGTHPLSDATAREGLPRLMRSLEAAQTTPDSLEARHEAQLAAWLCYQLPMESQTGPSHALGKRLGASFGIPHGVTSCLVLPAMLDVLTGSKLAALEQLLGGAPGSMLRAFISRLGLTRRLSEFGVGETQLAAVRSDFSHPALAASQLSKVLEAIQ